MNMLLLQGQMLNSFERPAFTNRETGEVRPSAHSVQVLCENRLRNGEIRMELVTLTVDDIGPYKGRETEIVQVPVGCFVNGSVVQFYATKGAKPAFARAGARSGASTAAAASAG